MLFSRFRALFLGAGLLASLAASRPAPAQAGLILAPAESSLSVHGIPLPQDAAPVLAASLSLENLQVLAPKSGELGRGWLRAVVYNYPVSAPPDEVAAYYRSVMPGAPLVMPRQLGTRARPAPEDGIRVLQLQGPARYLAIRSVEPTGEARVTVALYQGNALPGTVLNAVDALSRNGEGAATQTSLLSPQRWERESKFEGQELQLFQRYQTPSTAPEPVVDVLRSLLNQARSLHLRSYRLTRLIGAPEVLQACMQEARANRWRLLSVEAESAAKVTALYCYPENRGMVMLRVGPGQAKSVALPGTGKGILAASMEISRLEVTGPIRLQDLFRPIQVRPRALTIPGFGVPDSRAPFGTAPPRSPFSAQPRR